MSLCYSAQLPAEAGEKMGVSITVLLAYSVYLSIIADSLPSTSEEASAAGFIFHLVFLLSFKTGKCLCFSLRHVTPFSVTLSVYYEEIYSTDAICN